MNIAQYKHRYLKLFKKSVPQVGDTIYCPECCAGKTFEYGELETNGIADGFIWSCAECDMFMTHDQFITFLKEK
jgi:hypothetical protein